MLSPNLFTSPQSLEATMTLNDQSPSNVLKASDSKSQEMHMDKDPMEAALQEAW